MKTYVLDTNVLVQAPHAILSFEENAIVLPVAVLEELDRLKGNDGDTGMNARVVIRTLDALRGSGSLIKGVDLPNGGKLRIEINNVHVPLPDLWIKSLPDNRILQVCKGLIDDGTNAILVSRDIVVRLKADILGIPAEDFSTDQSPALDSQYTGRAKIYAPDDKMATFKKKGIPVKKVYSLDSSGERQPVEPVRNQFYIIHSDINEKKTLLGRYNGTMIVPLVTADEHPFGVRPRNAGQRFMQEALMLDPLLAPLVIIKGSAGTAKTFYSLAVGLQKIMEERDPVYRRILMSRSNVQFDEDIGFLPGSEQEKIAPLFRSVIDNLEVLVDRDEKERYRNEKELRDKVNELFERGIITTEALNFIRGRSLAQTYLIIDEAQNLTPRQVKGIITRAGHGTKIVLIGDPGQIDHPLLDARTNGLSYAAERMKGSPFCFQLTMDSDECERSDLALDAAMRM